MRAEDLRRFDSASATSGFVCVRHLRISGGVVYGVLRYGAARETTHCATARASRRSRVARRPRLVERLGRAWGNLTRGPRGLGGHARRRRAEHGMGCTGLSGRQFPVRSWFMEAGLDDLTSWTWEPKTTAHRTVVAEAHRFVAEKQTVSWLTRNNYRGRRPPCGLEMVQRYCSALDDAYEVEESQAGWRFTWRPRPTCRS